MPPKKKPTVKIGDFITLSVKHFKSEPRRIENGYVIGFAAFDEDQQVVVIASKKVMGVAFNIEHIDETIAYNFSLAKSLRERYLDKNPGHLLRSSLDGETQKHG